MKKSILILPLFLIGCYGASSQTRYPFAQFSSDFKRDSAGILNLRGKYVQIDVKTAKTYINDSIYSGLSEGKLLSILGKPNWISGLDLVTRTKMSDSVHVLNYGLGEKAWVYFIIKKGVVITTAQAVQ